MPDSGATSGMLLLTYPGGVDVGQPFKIAVEMLVVSVDMHNLNDSAAAILGSFSGPYGGSPARAQLI